MTVPMAKARKAPARPSHIGRVNSGFMLAQGTVERLTALTDATGLSRGRIIDLAVDAVGVCGACDGSGRVGADKCQTCHGTGIRSQG